MIATYCAAALISHSPMWSPIGARMRLLLPIPPSLSSTARQTQLYKSPKRYQRNRRVKIGHSLDYEVHLSSTCLFNAKSSSRSMEGLELCICTWSLAWHSWYAPAGVSSCRRNPYSYTLEVWSTCLGRIGGLSGRRCPCSCGSRGRRI